MMWIFRLSIGNSTGNATEPWILVRTGMYMANEQYQQNSHKWKTWQLGFQTLQRYRYSELVFKSLDCFTVRPIFSTRPITRIKSFLFIYFILFYFFFWGGGWGLLSSNAFTIWCCIQILRPPRVIRRFKRRSCYVLLQSLHYCMQYNVILDCIIMAPVCIFQCSVITLKIIQR